MAAPRFIVADAPLGRDRGSHRGCRGPGISAEVAGGVVAIGRGIFTGTVHAVDRMNGHASSNRSR